MKILKISVVLIIILAIIYFAYIKLVKTSDDVVVQPSTVSTNTTTTVTAGPKKYVDLGKTYSAAVIDKSSLLNVVEDTASNGRG